MTYGLARIDELIVLLEDNDADAPGLIGKIPVVYGMACAWDKDTVNRGSTTPAQSRINFILRPLSRSQDPLVMILSLDKQPQLVP